MSRGRAHRIRDLDCLVELEGDRWLGVAAYNVEGADCELVLLEAFERRRGTGTNLLEAVVDRARAGGARRLWLITTNDNLDALRFYQRRGFALVAVHPNAIEESRKLKPEISLVGELGIPIRDELELERWLVTTEPGTDTGARA